MTLQRNDLVKALEEQREDVDNLSELNKKTILK